MPRTRPRHPPTFHKILGPTLCSRHRLALPTRTALAAENQHALSSGRKPPFSVFCLPLAPPSPPKGPINLLTALRGGNEARAPRKAAAQPACTLPPWLPNNTQHLDPNTLKIASFYPPGRAVRRLSPTPLSLLGATATAAHFPHSVTSLPLTGAALQSFPGFAWHQKPCLRVTYFRHILLPPYGNGLSARQSPLPRNPRLIELSKAKAPGPHSHL